jgi:hypothetical protein
MVWRKLVLNHRNIPKFVHDSKFIDYLMENEVQSNLLFSLWNQLVEETQKEKWTLMQQWCFKVSSNN